MHHKPRVASTVKNPGCRVGYHLSLRFANPLLIIILILNVVVLSNGTFLPGTILYKTILIKTMQHEYGWYQKDKNTLYYISNTKGDIRWLSICATEILPNS